MRQWPEPEPVLGLDFDDGDTTVELVTQRLRELDLAALVHTTQSQTTETPRLRAYVPLKVPADVTGSGWSLWRRKYTAFANALGAGTADPACTDPTRAFYLPVKSSTAAPYEWSYVAGSPLDFDSIVVLKCSCPRRDRRVKSPTCRPACRRWPPR